MDERDAGGYTVSYRRSDVAFPVIIMALAAGFFAWLAIVSGLGLWVLGSVASLAGAYYNWPLLEKGRPTIGANQYGIFVQGLGLIRWRAVQGVYLVPVAARSMMLHELEIVLAVPLASALVADWRQRPWHRQLMRLPWREVAASGEGGSTVVRVNLDAFDKPPGQVHANMLRMWRYYRS